MTVTNLRSNDAAAVCDEGGAFTNLSSLATTHPCVKQALTVPLGTSKDAYIRVEHGVAQNADRIHELSIAPQRCDG